MQPNLHTGQYRLGFGDRVVVDRHAGILDEPVDDCCWTWTSPLNIEDQLKSITTRVGAKRLVLRRVGTNLLIVLIIVMLALTFPIMRTSHYLFGYRSFGATVARST